MTSSDLYLSDAKRARNSEAPYLGGLLSALGAFVVVVTTGFYVASPPAAAGPVQPLDLAAAISGTVRGAATLKAAGWTGVLGDIIWAMGTILLAQEFERRGRVIGAAGWIAIFVSIILFTLVDGMTAFVLPELAAAGDTSGFYALKRLWDMLFLVGTGAYSIGAVVVLAEDYRAQRPFVRRSLAVATMAVALVGLAGAVLGCAGITAVPTDKICGASIGLGALLFSVVSGQIMFALGHAPLRPIES